MPFAKGERKKSAFVPPQRDNANFSSLRTAKSASKNFQLISKSPLICSQDCPPKPEPKARARRLIQYGGVCWTMSELSLSKIQTPTDAKLLRNFANGSRAKIFLPLNPSNFCPLAKIFVPPFINHLKDLQFIYYNGLLIFLSFGFVT